MKWKSTMFNRMFVKSMPRIPDQTVRNKMQTKPDFPQVKEQLSESGRRGRRLLTGGQNERERVNGW